MPFIKFTKIDVFHYQYEFNKADEKCVITVNNTEGLNRWHSKNVNDELNVLQ